MLGFGRSSFSTEALLREQRFVVLDTELTSLERRTKRVLSIGAVAMQGASIRLSEQFYRVINPGTEIPAATVRVHGLRPLDVEKAESPGAVLAEFREFAKDAVLVGHFVGIDLEALAKEMGGERLRNAAVDTAKVHRWLLRHGRYSEDLAVRYENVDLISLAKEYRLPVQEAHHALADAFLTAQLWQKLMAELEKHGVTRVRQAVRMGG